MPNLQDTLNYIIAFLQAMSDIIIKLKDAILSPQTMFTGIICIIVCSIEVMLFNATYEWLQETFIPKVKELYHKALTFVFIKIPVEVPKKLFNKLKSYIWNLHQKKNNTISIEEPWLKQNKLYKHSEVTDQTINIDEPWFIVKQIVVFLKDDKLILVVTDIMNSRSNIVITTVEVYGSYK